MRRTLYVLVIAACALPSGAAEAARGDDRCRPSGSRTVAATATARVFETKGRLPVSGGGSVRGSRVYGCLFSRGRPVLLGRQKPVDGDYEWVDRPRVRLAGRYVAYPHGFDFGMDGGEFLEVRDLRTGRRIYRTENDNLVNVHDVELATTGSVGWISDEEEESPNRGVHAWSRDGGRTRLDAGDDIAKKSLTLRDGTLFWVKGGLERSAPLP